ncbi:MAG: AlpA family phage regulatory protein [Rhodospirillales bacterium]|nr:AlpA family phage regulatory protein [Rhodospirillales bacterium]
MLKIVSFSDLKDRFGLTWTRVHVNRLIKAGQFPQKVQISAGRVGWLESEIEAWLRARADERAA